MGESFVDVSYRGLELGRRLKLRDVLPEAGYLEIPLPMPVGTEVELACDDGLRIVARVTAVHEQVGGSDQVPGMRLVPNLAGKAAEWWKGRIDAAAVAAAAAEAQAKADITARFEAEAAAAKAYAEEVAREAEAARAAEAAKAAEAVPVEVAVTPSGGSQSGANKKNGKGKGRARSPEPSVEEQPRPTSGPKATLIMSTEAVQAALAAATADDDRPADEDEAKRTTVMDAIDISMITGEAPPDVGAAAGDDDDSNEITIEEGDDEETGASKSGKTSVAGDKTKGKGPRRRKKR